MAYGRGKGGAIGGKGGGGLALKSDYKFDGKVKSSKGKARKQARAKV